MNRILSQEPTWRINPNASEIIVSPRVQLDRPQKLDSNYKKLLRKETFKLPSSEVISLEQAKIANSPSKKKLTRYIQSKWLKLIK